MPPLSGQPCLVSHIALD
uniref:Uncharacterized protein n=1 Tax=Arundo donax TaxID=35708 RepID=A0A0A8YT68_ARUDO